MGAADLFQLVLSGIATGGLYALIGVGFVTIYTVTGVINFAQGEFAMVAAMAAAAMLRAGVALPVAIVAAVLLAALVGAMMQQGALAPCATSTPLVKIIITIGLSIAIRGIVLLVWGSQPYLLPAFTAGPPISLGGAALARQYLWVLGLTASLMLALFVLFERTLFGSALRAVVMNQEASRLQGIHPARMALFAFVVSAMLSGMAGVAIAPITLATHDMGLMLGLKGFVAAVMGGLVSAPGAVVGALTLGVLESVGAGLISSGYKDAFAFLILVLVLFLRPSGLFNLGQLTRV